jgi:hypothetical protein
LFIDRTGTYFDVCVNAFGRRRSFLFDGPLVVVIDDDNGIFVARRRIQTDVGDD